MCGTQSPLPRCCTPGDQRAGTRREKYFGLGFVTAVNAGAQAVCFENSVKQRYNFEEFQEVPGQSEQQQDSEGQEGEA